MAKIIHYRNKCIGCGICEEQQPAFWRMSNKDGKATLLHAQVKKDIHVRVLPPTYIILTKELVMACPAKVIKLV